MPERTLAEEILALFLHFVAQDVGPDSRTPVILSAWVDGGEHVAVIYRSKFRSDLVLGFRRRFDSSLGIDRRLGATEIQETISEPLGDGVDYVRVDSEGVLWSGDLEEELPRAPQSPH